MTRGLRGLTIFESNIPAVDFFKKNQLIPFLPRLNRFWGLKSPPISFRSSLPTIQLLGFLSPVSCLGFGFRVSGLGSRVSGFGFRVSGFGFRVSASDNRVSILVPYRR